jgi:hypothetical protein
LLGSWISTIAKGLELPDAKDAHVLADAIKAGAQVIVTFDKRDFSREALEEFDIEAQHPDDFILYQKEERSLVAIAPRWLRGRQRCGAFASHIAPKTICLFVGVIRPEVRGRSDR